MTETPKPEAGKPAIDPVRPQDPSRDENNKKHRIGQGHAPGTSGQSDRDRDGGPQCKPAVVPATETLTHGQRETPGQERNPQHKPMDSREGHKRGPAEPEPEPKPEPKPRAQDGGTASV